MAGYIIGLSSLKTIRTSRLPSPYKSAEESANYVIGYIRRLLSTPCEVFAELEAEKMAHTSSGADELTEGSANESFAVKTRVTGRKRKADDENSSSAKKFRPESPSLDQGTPPEEVNYNDGQAHDSEILALL